MALHVKINQTYDVLMMYICMVPWRRGIVVIASASVCPPTEPKI
jgi:hypothetical protein